MDEIHFISTCVGVATATKLTQWQHTIQDHPDEYVAILWPTEDLSGRISYRKFFDIRVKRVTCKTRLGQLEIELVEKITKATPSNYPENNISGTYMAIQ